MNNKEKAILTMLVEQGGATLPDMAAVLDVSIGTATKELDSLRKKGLVRETGKIDTDSGRKPRRFGLNPESGYYAGVDLDSKYVNLGLMDMAGNLIQSRLHVEYKLENTTASLRNLCEIIRGYRSRIPGYLDRLRGICINIPGRINRFTGYSYTYFNFTDKPLTTILSDSLGYPTCIDNDTRTLTYAHYLNDCPEGEKNIIFVNVNWGLGIGMVLNGRLYYGKSGFSGEFGHIHTYANQVICQCGKRGCLETEVSGQALRRKLTERIRHGETSILSTRVLESDTPLSLEEITDAVRREDTLCIEVIEEIGSLLGVQIGGLINIFNPNLVIIGGELAMTGDYLLQPVRTAVNRHALSRVTSDTTIRASRMGEDSGILGACLTARSAELGLLDY